MTGRSRAAAHADETARTFYARQAELRAERLRDVAVPPSKSSAKSINKEAA